MSVSHKLSIPAHHNIYTGKAHRELRIEFCIPDDGVNQDTGIIIFVPGFGGNIDSNVYKKMRGSFADRYNMVTIQCDYFGSMFMQGADNISFNSNQLQSLFTRDELDVILKEKNAFNALINLMNGKNISLSAFANLNESMDNFNDMSYMQAIDIITAIETVKIILAENNLKINDKRIIGYGHSHGAYLLHLSNCIAPHIFSFIIDNSAWMEPLYLSGNRMMYQRYGQSMLVTQFDYMAKKIIPNKADLNLRNLYRFGSGYAQILTFQGDQDNLVNHVEKRELIESLDNSDFILVTEDDVDHIKYKSNQHGLDADFLELFSYALEFEQPQSGSAKDKNSNYEISYDGVHINVDYTHGLPVFYFDFTS